MSLAFVVIGVVAGLVASLAVWVAGGGLGLVFLAYVGCGTVGMVAGVALMITSRLHSDRPPLSQPHSQG